MKGFYIFSTCAGHFTIVDQDEHWHAMFEDEHLGIYKDPQQALNDLAQGRTAQPSCGSPADLGLPGDLSQWLFVGT